MQTLSLVRPDSQFEDSLRSFVREFDERGETLVPWVLKDLGEDIEAYVEYLQSQSLGKNLEADRVPHSTFWLIDGSARVVAVSNLRHRLNVFLSEIGGHIGFGVRPSARRRGFATEVLGRTVLEARKLGIERVFVTCDKGNIGSERAILRNGGKLQDEVWSDSQGCVVLRYWIDAK